MSQADGNPHRGTLKLSTNLSSSVDNKCFNGVSECYSRNSFLMNFFFFVRVPREHWHFPFFFVIEFYNIHYILRMNYTRPQYVKLTFIRLTNVRLFKAIFESYRYTFLEKTCLMVAMSLIKLNHTTDDLRFESELFPTSRNKVGL